MFRYLYSTILFYEGQTHVKLIYITTDKLFREFRINFLRPTNKIYQEYFEVKCTGERIRMRIVTLRIIASIFRRVRKIAKSDH